MGYPPLKFKRFYSHELRDQSAAMRFARATRFALRRRFATQPIIDLERYPINDLQSSAGRALVESAQRDLERTGCASFPSFLHTHALASASADADQKSHEAYVTDAVHNAYQRPALDARFSDDHVRNVRMQTRVASTAFDELDEDGVLKRLYRIPALVRFVSAVTGRELFPLADPVGAASINVFKPGWSHAWHFDESEFTTTLCLQQAESGGKFQFSPRLRDSDSDLASDAVAALINARSEYAVVGDTDAATEPPAHAVTTAAFDPGTLQIFAGRYSLHRVTSVEGRTARLVAVLCFATERGCTNSPSVQSMFWGRTVAAG